MWILLVSEIISAQLGSSIFRVFFISTQNQERQIDGEISLQLLHEEDPGLKIDAVFHEDM